MPAALYLILWAASVAALLAAYRAAAALANRHGWLKDGMRLTGGGLPNGRGYAFVFTTANAADNQ